MRHEGSQLIVMQSLSVQDSSLLNEHEGALTSGGTAAAPNRIQAQQLVQGPQMNTPAPDSNSRTEDVAGYRCCSLHEK